MKFTNPLVAVVATIGALAPPVASWGLLGHRTAALLSTRYLLPETAVFIRSKLYRDETIMSASTWADRYAHVPLGRYSAPWHYIDAMDDPPSKCGIKYNRDCHGAEGCIVSAIVNMTSRVVDNNLPWYQHSQAIKFLLHFIADIHQPLHTENLKRGGNSIHVRFHNYTTNLHTVWDSKIIDAATGGNSERHALVLTNLLEDRIDNGMYETKKKAWRSCLATHEAEKCIVEWAGQANKWVCEYVLKMGEEEITDSELTGEYADNAVEIIRELLAMAGYRLAGWMNTIVTGRSGLEDPKDLALIKSSRVSHDLFRGESDQPVSEEDWELFFMEMAEEYMEDRGGVVNQQHVLA